MSEKPILDTKVLAQTYRDQPPPYECPACHKSYRSQAGILYHIGQFRSVTGVPRCQLGEETPPRGSPARTPGSPMSASRSRRAPKREALTWAESQRLVEVEFPGEYRRVEIDWDLALLDNCNLDDGVEAGSDGESVQKVTTGQCKTPQKRTRADTPRGCKTQSATASSSSSKNKSKRRSKMKNQAQDAANPDPALPVAEFEALDTAEFPEAPQRDAVYYRFVDQSPEELDELVEYDMDEEDHQWLTLINEERKNDGHTSVPQEAFELLMDRLEKECIFESHLAGPGNESNPYNIDENAVCCICNDGECHNTNAILFCDMCNLAVHQECYGVPYIPEGQWLCRRCLQSPSRSVDCVLCPNKGGAFKQTLDGRWAHVICALWIPEVQFANTVFLEPIDGIHDVPAARWKLMCYICRKRMGACIQCAKANCYTAFHVTCSQQAHLYMKIEIAKGGEVRKTAYCDCHTPLSARKKLMESLDAEDSEDSPSDREEELRGEEGGGGGEAAQEGGGTEGGEEAVVAAAVTAAGEGEGKRTKSESKVVKRARKLLEEQQVAQAPVVNLPYIPQSRLNGIINRVSLHKKSQFIPKLVSYWKLKRQSRNGVPLLRRLQAINKNQKQAVTTNLTEEEKTALMEQLSLWQGLRRDLEKARLLVELVRKREKLKREQLRLWEEITRLRLTPLSIVMKRVLQKVATKDPANIFAEPVCTEEVPDYLDVIRHPMDFSTMRRKVEAHQYNSMREFEKDLCLVWNNAMVYNQKDTIYYRAAVRIKEAAKRILEVTQKQLDVACISRSMGMHDPDVEEPPPLTPRAAAYIQQQPTEVFTREGEYAETPIATRNRLVSATLDEQVEYLEEKISMLESQCKKGSVRKTREKQLRKELSSLRRQIKQRERASDPNIHLLATLPRRRVVGNSPPRDAEGLASQLLHGSLRLTVSRRAILSSSGIRLEERATAMRERGREERALPRRAMAAASAADRAKKRTCKDPVVEDMVDEDEEEDEEEEEEEEEESDLEEEQVNDSDDEEEEDDEMSEGDGDEEEERKGKRPEAERRRPAPGVGGQSTANQRALRSSRASATSRAGHRPPPAQRRRPRRRNRSYPMACERRVTRRSTTNSSSVAAAAASAAATSGSRRSLLSETSNSESDAAVNGARLLRSKLGSSSSGADDFGYDDRGFQSPFSDTVSESLRLETPLEAMACQPIPSASSLDNLTIRAPLEMVRKRKRSTGSDGDIRPSSKRSALLVKEAARQLLKGVNGMSNGGQQPPQPLDLVWAKCRGYPPYPALVIDPCMPEDGMRVNGEFIQAPSEEVLEHKEKNPQNTILVRFFDGRRTWQWLPPSKIDYLGVNKEYDQTLVGSSGPSKRSVQQAYERAMRYRRKVMQSNADEESDCSSAS